MSETCVSLVAKEYLYNDGLKIWIFMVEEVGT
jgi:hypothetical protein